MKKLLKEYNLTTNAEYYEMVTDSYINGQLAQAERQFKGMPYENQKEMLAAIDEENFSDSFYNNLYEFFFNLL